MLQPSQHVVDKFCIVSGLIVAKKVLHYQNKCLPCFQFHFVHWVFELWISDKLLYLRTVKDASFQLLHGQSWKSLAQISEAVTILVQSHQHDKANIPQHSWSENTGTCADGVSYTFHGAADPPTLVLIHQLYALPYQFLEDFEVLWLPTDPFST